MDEQELKLRIKRFLARKNRKFHGLDYELTSEFQNTNFEDEENEYEGL